MIVECMEVDLEQLTNVIHLEAGHTRKRDRPARYFRDKLNF
jgi:hypothetical protein